MGREIDTKERSMLCLRVRAGDVIWLGDDIEIQVNGRPRDGRGSVTQICILAPRSIDIKSRIRGKTFAKRKDPRP